MPLVEVEDETVSSTHIRGLVAAGDVERAARFLGAPFMLDGEVVSGDRRGRELGFPTANIVPPDHLAHPGHGVYAAWAHGHMAAVNVGVRPTFDTGRGLLVEAYLIDFDGDLYGETLRIAFARRLRGERRFENADALVEQMKRDVEDARQILARSERMKPLLLCTAILMLFASVAEAAKFTGRTAQDRKVVVRTDADNVPIQFGMRWRAECEDRSNIVHATTFLQPFRESSETRVRDGGPYTTHVRDDRGRRYELRVRTRMRAHRVTDTQVARQVPDDDEGLPE